VSRPTRPIRPRTARIAGAAALIAALTVVARLAGFGRTVVFAWAIGDNDLGDIYLAANLIPNIVFEIVAGGALASLVVPLLAGAVAAGDRAAVARTTSALLTWAVALLVPLALGLALAAGPIIDAMTGDAPAAEVTAGTRMLQVFAPQLPLYGIGIVLTGVLQAHRRFAWPVLAPLLSSVTVATAYLTFVLVYGRGIDVAGLSAPGLLVLAIGTTLGVVVLAGCLVPPVARLGVRVRPGWRFPADARARVGGLAAAGAATVAAQHLALLVVVWRGLAGPDGTWVLFTLAQTIFLVPWAVLAVPLATAAYPGLAEAAATDRPDRYRATLAATTRATLLLSALGVAGLVALAAPIATLVGLLMPGAGLASVDRLTAGIAGFAPGLAGYGLFAVLSRALYARGDTTAAAVAAASGWAAVAGAAMLLAAVLPEGARVLALTGANAVGMTVLGAALLLAVARAAGRSGLAGLARTGLAVVPAAGLAAGAGWVVARAVLPVTHPPAVGPVVGSGMLAGVVVVGVFGAVAWTLDQRDVRPMVAVVAGRLRRRDGRTNRPETTGDEDRVP
jgi:putative peptidoglycan lipid II flippase